MFALLDISFFVPYTLNHLFPFTCLQKYLADILSVLALTMSAEGERVAFKFFIFGNTIIVEIHIYVSNFHSLLVLISIFVYNFFRSTILQESLKYRLLGSEGDIGSWGHEYVR